MVVLDTNIIISHLRQQENIDSELTRVYKEFGREYLALSVITIQELYEGQSTRKSKELSKMLSVISPLSILSYDIQISKLAGEIARDLNNPIEFADAAIAATCIENDFELFTLNIKHFKDIKELKLYNL